MSECLEKSGDEKAFNEKDSAARRCQRESVATIADQVGDELGAGVEEADLEGLFQTANAQRRRLAWQCLRAREGSSAPTSS